MGGILTGVFTPTEAAIVTVVYAIAISVFIYHSLNLKDFWQACVDTVEFTANIHDDRSAADKPIRLDFDERKPPAKIRRSHSGTMVSSGTIVMIVIAAFVLFLGCFMEGTAMMMILVPILMPVIVKFNIDPVHLGVVFVLVEMIGLLTPPFAVNINIVSSIVRDEFRSDGEGPRPPSSSSSA